MFCWIYLFIYVFWGTGNEKPTFLLLGYLYTDADEKKLVWAAGGLLPVLRSLWLPVTQPGQRCSSFLLVGMLRSVRKNNLCERAQLKKWPSCQRGDMQRRGGAAENADCPDPDVYYRQHNLFCFLSLTEHTASLYLLRPSLLIFGLPQKKLSDEWLFHWSCSCSQSKSVIICRFILNAVFD